MRKRSTKQPNNSRSSRSSRSSSSSRGSRGSVAVVPSLHALMIGATVGLIIVSLVFYAFVPESRAGLYVNVATLLMGFLTGKLSNSFGKPFISGPALLEAEPDEELARELARRRTRRRPAPRDDEQPAEPEEPTPDADPA